VAQRRLRRVFETPLRKPSRLQALFGQGALLTDLIRRRAAAAEALGRIESGSGAQPAFWRLPYGEPVWVDIPAGEFWMGSDRGHEEEKPLHRQHLGDYQISRVPITNAQYLLFVQATGHQQAKSLAGWPPAARPGKPPGG